MPSTSRPDSRPAPPVPRRVRAGALAIALLGTFAVGLVAAVPTASASWATDSSCYAVDGYRSGTALAADCTFRCRTGDSIYVAVNLGYYTGPLINDVWVAGHGTCGSPGEEATASCERHFPQCDDWSNPVYDTLDPLGLNVHLGTCHGEAWGVPMSSTTVTVQCWTSSTNRDPLLVYAWCDSGLCHHMPMAGPVPQLLFGPNPVVDAVREIDPFIV